MTARPTINPADVPFSLPGSWLALSHVGIGAWTGHRDVAPGLWLRSVRGEMLWRWSGLLHAQPLNGKHAVETTVSANPVELRQTCAEGRMAWRFAGPNRLLISGRGLGLRLTQAGQGFAAAIDARSCRMQGPGPTALLLRVQRGSLALDAPWMLDSSGHHPVHRCASVVAALVPDADGRIEAMIEEWCGAPDDRPLPTWAAAGAATRDAFSEFARALPEVPRPWRNARALADYVLWSSEVPAGGHLTRRTLLMSKNWMHAVWSWDHAFNALALGRGHRRLAWDQFMLFYDRQHASGMLADNFTDTSAGWNYAKPPIHGWALGHLMRLGVAGLRELNEVYAPMARHTRWWLERRDEDGDGVPQYNHGNDSGWDNCPLFDFGFPVEAPDLSAYLVLQLDTLAAVATRLGKRREARRWRAEADDLLARLLSHCWRGDRFIAPRSGDHRAVEDCHSLLAYMPLLLGDRLPDEVRTAALARLEASRLLTPFGPATVEPGDARYQADGYWRGSIWAPTTVLLVDGLDRCGRRDLATRVARAFCANCVRSGFAECYDAESGAPQRDRAYTWAASGFLLLAARCGDEHAR